MDTSRLYVGLVVKNYKELCELLGEPVKSGNAKKYKLIDWDRYFKYNKDGYKFVITEIYNTAMDKLENRGGARNKARGLSNTLGELIEYLIDDYGHNIDELKVESELRLRWICINCNEEHDKEISKVYKSKNTRCLRCSISTGERSILDLLEEFNIKYVKELMFNDLKGKRNLPLRFDYGIYNEESLVGIIEYDGEFHDTHEDTIRNDLIKNEYCKVNNIPLYRIHHKHKSNIMTATLVILMNMDLDIDSMNIVKSKFNSLFDVNKYIVN